MTVMILGLAPMDWITDLPYRVITKRIFDKYNNNPNYKLVLWTEFMTSDWYIANPDKVIKHIIHTEFENPIILQIFWWNINKLISTALDLQQKYKNKLFWIELNTWCPANNVMKSWWGSALLKDKKNTLKIIKEISKKLNVPFSIKSRTWLDEKDKKLQMDFLIEASKYCQIISIHCRTLKELYNWEWDRNFIYDLKNKISKNCKIIWNWAIKSYSDINNKIGNLDGIMIGQAAIWNPRIFTNHTPTIEEKYKTIIEHLKMLAKYEIFTSDLNPKNLGLDKINPNLENIESINIEENYNKIRYTPLLFRKYLHQYLKSITWWKELKEICNKTTDLNETIKHIDTFFKKIA